MNEILDEVIDKHGEYLEMLPVEEHSAILISILSAMVKKERDYANYLKKRLQYASNKQ
jgi:hypothetical protein